MENAQAETSSTTGMGASWNKEHNRDGCKPKQGGQQGWVQVDNKEHNRDGCKLKQGAQQEWVQAETRSTTGMSASWKKEKNRDGCKMKQGAQQECVQAWNKEHNPDG